MENQISALKNIQIKTIIIDGKKMTRCHFNQVEEYDCINSDIEFKGDEIYGYVNSSGKRCLLWSRKGLLRRTNLAPYYNSKYASEDDFTHRHIWFLRLIRTSYSTRDEYAGKLRDDVEELDTFKQKIKKLGEFLSTIKGDMQLFL